MTTIVNFRVDTALRDAANMRAKQLGLPLSTIFRKLLASFSEGKTPLVFGEVEEIPMTKTMQKRAQSFDNILETAVAKKRNLVSK